MSTITPTASRLSSSQPWNKVAVLTVLLAVVAFVASPNAPVGKLFWPPHSSVPTPTAAQLPLFILLNLAEVLTFGLGVSFLIFGLPITRSIAPASPMLTRAAHLSIGWLLANWWPHDSLHLHFGLELNGLLAIEYGFHVTLMIAGLILAAYFLQVLRAQKANA